jgi:hypothetical protein
MGINASLVLFAVAGRNHFRRFTNFSTVKSASLRMLAKAFGNFSFILLLPLRSDLLIRLEGYLRHFQACLVHEGE